MIKRMICIAILLLAVTASASADQNVPVWTGDFNDLVERRVIRALVPYSQTYYFIDKGRPMGLTYEKLIAFEKSINKALKKRHLIVHVVVIPTPRDLLIPHLVQGRGDIAAGNLTVTDARKQEVDFSNPLLTRVNEIIVTGPKSPKLKTIADLSGKTVHVRESSSYYESLEALNKTFKSRRKKQIKLVKVDDFMEDEDLLEMLNAGMLSAIVVDDHKARFWEKILDRIVLHPDIAVRTKGRIAWAVRKKSPDLLAQINAFVKTSKKGTLFGNIVFERYLERTDHVKPLPDRRNSYDRTTALFKKYAEQYGFDWLLLKAMAFQESGINQKKKSPRGAVGVMQVLPSTAKDPNVDIPDIHQLENNIHAGTKYLRFLKDRYFSGDGIDDRNRTLLALAAYNAGPGQMTTLRKEAAEQDLNPNVWFKNVEVAAARRIGRETVQYVNNIFKYYIAYSGIYDIRDKKEGS